MESEEFVQKLTNNDGSNVGKKVIGTVRGGGCSAGCPLALGDSHRGKKASEMMMYI